MFDYNAYKINFSQIDSICNYRNGKYVKISFKSVTMSFLSLILSILVLLPIYSCNNIMKFYSRRYRNYNNYIIINVAKIDKKKLFLIFETIYSEYP